MPAFEPPGPKSAEKPVSDCGVTLILSVQIAGVMCSCRDSTLVVRRTDDKIVGAGHAIKLCESAVAEPRLWKPSDGDRDKRCEAEREPGDQRTAQTCPYDFKRRLLMNPLSPNSLTMPSMKKSSALTPATLGLLWTANSIKVF